MNIVLHISQFARGIRKARSNLHIGDAEGMRITEISGVHATLDYSGTTVEIRKAMRTANGGQSNSKLDRPFCKIIRGLQGLLPTNNEPFRIAGAKPDKDSKSHAEIQPDDTKVKSVS